TRDQEAARILGQTAPPVGRYALSAPGGGEGGVRWGMPESPPAPTSPSQRSAPGPSLSPLKGGEGKSDDTVTVGEADGTLRLDRWFRRHYPGLAHGRLERLLRTGQVKVDGKRAKSGDRVSPGMAIRVPPMTDAPLTGERLTPQARPQDEAALRDAIIHS